VASPESGPVHSNQVRSSRESPRSAGLLACDPGPWLAAVTRASLIKPREAVKSLIKLDIPWVGAGWSSAALRLLGGRGAFLSLDKINTELFKELTRTRSRLRRPEALWLRASPAGNI